MSNVAHAVVLILALVATSCSSASDEAAPDISDTATTTTTSTTIATTTTTTAPTTTTVPTTTTPTVALGSGPLEALVGQRQSGEFWYVGPGDYTISILPVELEVTIDEELSFVVVRESFVAFADPGFLTFNAAPSLTLAELSGLADPAVNDQEVRSDPTSVPFGDDAMVTAYFEGTEPFVLLDTGTDDYLGGEASWWEFTVDSASSGEGFRCAFSPSCFNVVVEPDHGNFVAAPGWVFRLWRFETGDGTIWGFLQTPEDQVDEGTALADAVLAGLSRG